MNRRSFIAKLVGCALAPIAVAKACVSATKPNPQMLDAYWFQTKRITHVPPKEFIDALKRIKVNDYCGCSFSGAWGNQQPSRL